MIFFIIIPFLAAGCLAFLLCAAIKPLRRFALNASLWFASAGVCLIGVFFFYLIVSFGLDTIFKTFKPEAISRLGTMLSTKPWFIFLPAILITIVGATSAVWIHQLLIHRITLALFRLYVLFVSAGVGFLTGIFCVMASAKYLPLLTYPIPFVAFCFGLAASVGIACYKHASQFRGHLPDILPMVTQEEFKQIPR